jgi:phosphopantetheinyl transferase (holo-ACP synthase)
MLDVEKTILSLQLEGKKDSVKAFFGLVSHDSYKVLEKNLESILHEAELPYFSSLKFLKRKKDYLTGCFIAKSMIAKYLDEKNLSSIQISSGVFKHPFIRYQGWEIPGVSVSHSDEYSGAIVFPQWHPMGIDIEKINISKHDIIKTQLTIDEVNILQKNDRDNIDTYCQIWAIKEALSKSLKCGLTTPFSVLEIDKVEFADGGKIQCHFKNFGQYRSYSFLMNGYAIALVMPKNTVMNIFNKLLFK